MELVAAIAEGFAAVLLGTAAVRKFVDRVGWFNVLQKHPFLRSSAPVLVGAVPVVEAALAILLLVARVPRVPAIGAALLFAGFIVVTYTMPPGDCGCGPFVPRKRSVRSIMNLLLVGGLAIPGILDLNPSRGDRVLAAAILVVAVMSLWVIRAWQAVRPRPTVVAVKFLGRNGTPEGLGASTTM